MKKELYDDSWMYTLLLSTLVILIETIKGYTFRVLNCDLTFSLILLPLVFIILNYILKKYNVKKAIKAIIISSICMIAFIFIICFAIGRDFLITNLIGDVCGYISAQIVNLIMTSFLMKNTKPSTITTFGTYMFSLIVMYMAYTLIYLNVIALDNYWKSYLLTLGIQSIICLPLAVIDKYIKQGR